MKTIQQLAAEIRAARQLAEEELNQERLRLVARVLSDLRKAHGELMDAIETEPRFSVKIEVSDDYESIKMVVIDNINKTELAHYGIQYYTGAYEFMSGAEHIILDLDQMLESNDPTTPES